MFGKKKSKTEVEETPIVKEKKLRVRKENTHRKSVLVLWFLFIVAFVFSVYKNFTAIDVHTIHETETIKEEVFDTNAIETFTRGFAWNYYGWENTREGQEKWQQALSNYMTDDLQKLNMSSMPSGLSTEASVNSVDIWSVEQAGKAEYKVVYSVGQTVTEGKGKNWVFGAYMIRVHVDEEGNMVIVQNPSMYQAPGVSEYKPKELTTSGDLSAKQQEITAFLDTFFKMYPTATENELEFYVADNALPTILVERCTYNKLESVVLNQGKDETINAAVTVSYVDSVTNLTQYNQYELVLKKGDNWKIVKEGFGGE